MCFKFVDLYISCIEFKGISVIGLFIGMLFNLIIFKVEIKFIEVYLIIIVLNELKFNIGFCC